MSISYYKGMLLNNMADATKINYKAYYNNYILFGANASPEPEPSGYEAQYMTMIAKSSGTFYFSGSTTTNTISYSRDSGTTWSTPARLVSINVSTNDKVMWKGTLVPTETGGVSGSCVFSASTASFDVEGNAMSLLYGDNFKNQKDLTGKRYALYNLFRKTKVVSAENMVLPATTLETYCYGRIFQDCTSLITAPQLPATTIAHGCYRSLFEGCTAMVNPPTELPALVICNESYYNMFLRCSKMTTTPTILATSFDTSGSGTQHCNAMFYGCSKVNYIKVAFESVPNLNYLANWTQSVASSGTFVKKSALTLPRGTNGIPNNWTIIDE